jgi:hypothetical protein
MLASNSIVSEENNCTTIPVWLQSDSSTQRHDQNQNNSKDNLINTGEDNETALKSGASWFWGGDKQSTTAITTGGDNNQRGIDDGEGRDQGAQNRFFLPLLFYIHLCAI